MPKKTLEEIKAVADEYAQVMRQLANAEKKRDAELQPILERHARQLQPIHEAHDPKIDRLELRATQLKAEVLGFVQPKVKTYRAETDLVEFGVEVGTKAGPRVIDRDKFVKLCKKKGVDMWNVVKIMVEKADELLGKKEVNEISTPSSVPTRNEYLRLK